MNWLEHSYSVFAGNNLVCRGTLIEAALGAKEHHDRGGTGRIALYQDATGSIVEVNLTEAPDEMLDKLANHPLVSKPLILKDDKPDDEHRQKGPGRPRLGVVCKEVSLLPRHWDWLGDQPGGASGTLRKLVEEAKRKNRNQDLARRAKEAIHRFMWDIAANFHHFEEACRAFFAKDYSRFNNLISPWPQDVKDHLQRLIEEMKPLEERADAEAAKG